MSFTKSALISDLKASLLDSADKFTAPGDVDFIRHIDHALIDLATVRPRIVRDTLAIVADQTDYTPPADLISVQHSDWGRNYRKTTKPWAADYIKQSPPLLDVMETATGKKLVFSHAPTAAEITAYGASADYYYRASHTLSDTLSETTVQPQDRPLLILRAQAEAMKELANRNIAKPAQLRDGLNSTPKNGTPAALFEQLMKEFRAAA